MNFAQLLALDPSSFRRRPVSPGYTPINYGLLYNWYATQEQTGGIWLISDAMRAAGWRMPIEVFDNGDIVSGDFTDLTDQQKQLLNLKDSGFRDSFGFYKTPTEFGIWVEISGTIGYWYFNGSFVDIIDYILSWTGTNYIEDSCYGFSIRPVRPATAAEQLLPDGTACDPYICNDGKVYRTVKIGTQVWLADNLAETKWSDGSWIAGFDGGTYTPISNAAWAALTTPALCAYDDDINNV